MKRFLDAASIAAVVILVLGLFVLTVINQYMGFYRLLKWIF